MNIVIVANGQGFSNTIFTQKVKEADCIIAADGGIYNCISNGVFPNYVIGDIDSFENIMDLVTQKTKVIHIDDQDTTDMQKALSFSKSLNPDSVDIFCSFGKRTDHSLGNIFILNNYDGMTIYMYDENGMFRMLKPGIHYFKNKVGITVSLFCIDRVKNIELNGFKYPLKQPTIGPAFFGVSNEISDKNAYVKFSEGRLMVYEFFD
jgi:thiamine pyrophosphokinase